MDQSTLECG